MIRERFIEILTSYGLYVEEAVFDSRPGQNWILFSTGTRPTLRFVQPVSYPIATASPPLGGKETKA
jgi:hypothetical protein